MRLFDAHCHLTDDVYRYDIENIVTESLNAGVRKMLTCATSEADWSAVLSVINEFPDSVIGAIGIHPWYVSDLSGECFDKMEHILKENPFLSIGEIGLDFALKDADKSLQEDVLKKQLHFASELERPVSLHCVKAYDSLIKIIKESGGVSYGGIIHSFSGSVEILKEILDIGLVPSFSASVCNDGNKKLQQVLNVIGKDGLIIETDAPSQVPFFVDEGYNRPKNLNFVAKKLAEIFYTDIFEIADITYRNTADVFGCV